MAVSHYIPPGHPPPHSPRPLKSYTVPDTSVATYKRFSGTQRSPPEHQRGHPLEVSTGTAICFRSTRVCKGNPGGVFGGGRALGGGALGIRDHNVKALKLQWCASALPWQKSCLPCWPTKTRGFGPRLPEDLRHYCNSIQCTPSCYSSILLVSQERLCSPLFVPLPTHRASNKGSTQPPKCLGFVASLALQEKKETSCPKHSLCEFFAPVLSISCPIGWHAWFPSAQR